jgi:cobalt-precorrin-7 (C5)-methyltransferase
MQVWVIGIGPGDPDLVHQQARRLIESADLVAGFTTVLNVVRPWVQGELLDLTYRNQDEQLARFADRVKAGARGVVCAWGDANVSNREMQERVSRALGGHLPTVIPGISSVQIALARLGLALEDVLFTTIHTRAPVAEAVLEGAAMLRSANRRVLSLIRPYEIMPNHLAARWLEAGVPPQTPAAVLERLSLPDERLTFCTLGELAAATREFSDLSIVVAGRGVGE